MAKSYELTNYTKFSTKKRRVTITSTITSCHSRFGVLSTLKTPFHLKIITVFTVIISNQVYILARRWK